MGKTQWLRVEHADVRDDAIQRAAEMLRDGKLVAFPTETVYGLGARVGNENAVRRIFTAKGRPAAVPLIVHVRDVDHAGVFVKGMQGTALRLGREHWPGPLTLVMERSERVPDGVTAGGSSVGVRVPAHPVALALIDALGDGIAAPSANPYERLPPVRAEHVLSGLEGRIDAVLDAGRCPGGLESTVLDVRFDPAVLLRRGAVDVDTFGIGVRQGVMGERVICDDGWIRVGEAAEFEAWLRGQTGKVGRLGLSAEGVVVREMPRDAHGYAVEMYESLHELWMEGCRRVWVDAPPVGGQWEPIWDRLSRLSKVSGR